MRQGGFAVTRAMARHLRLARRGADSVKSRLGLADTALRRHNARGDVDLLARAVAAMCQRLGLDPAMNGVPRHPTRLPVV